MALSAAGGHSGAWRSTPPAASTCLIPVRCSTAGCGWPHTSHHARTPASLPGRWTTQVQAAQRCCGAWACCVLSYSLRSPTSPVVCLAAYDVVACYAPGTTSTRGTQRERWTASFLWRVVNAPSTHARLFLPLPAQFMRLPTIHNNTDPAPPVAPSWCCVVHSGPTRGYRDGGYLLAAAPAAGLAAFSAFYAYLSSATYLFSRRLLPTTSCALVLLVWPSLPATQRLTPSPHSTTTPGIFGGIAWALAQHTR